MRRTLLLSSIALGAFLGTAGLRYVVQQGRVDELARLRSENADLRFEISRKHTAALRAEGRSPKAPPAVEVAPAAIEGAPPPAGYAADYRDEGNAEPVAALQTFAWAGDRGDAEAVQRLITFDDPALRKALSFFQALPPEARSRYPSVEALAAAELTADIIKRPFPRSHVLERAVVETKGPDRVDVRLVGAAREHNVFQRTSSGWKFVITEEMVDRFLARRRQ